MSLLLATQITAVATAILAVFAIATAWYARKAFRAQAEEVSAINAQLKAQQELNEKQTPVLELQVQELHLSLDERKREVQERRRAQARLVSAWVNTKGTFSPRYAEDIPPTTLELMNGSAEPIYGLLVGTVFIQGAAPRSLEDWFETKKRTEGQEQTQLSPPVAILSILPPGRWRIEVQGMDSVLGGGRIGAELAFTDRADAHWIRRGKGNLEELPSPPFEYFQQFGMYGPPYDFQIPEAAE
jgi:hypothetical protein